MAGIGYLCVQWALLEHTILGLISTVENLPLEKTYLVFSGLDMRPRLSMAINLLHEAKAPRTVIKIVTDVRDALKKEGLTDARNRAVHGVHSDAGAQDAIKLTMPREKMGNRDTVVTAIELAHVGNRLNALANDLVRAREEFFRWHIGVQENRLKDAERQLREANTPIVLKVAKHAYAAAKRRWPNLKN